MATSAFDNLLQGKADAERIAIAQRAGGTLGIDDLTEADRQAAETIVRLLANDAIERVRVELSHAVKNAKQLSRDIAIKIAHDVDAVACPFLEVTEVFTDDEWRQLVLTISRGALISVARRPSMSEELAIAVAEVGDSIVAETLIENDRAPMANRVCLPIVERFEGSTWVLDKLAERSDVSADIATKLITKVSEAAKQKLETKYGIGERAAPIASQAENASLVKLAWKTPEERYASMAQRLYREKKLTVDFLTNIILEGPVAFFEAALTVLTGARIEKVRSVVRREGAEAMGELLRQTQIPMSQHSVIVEALDTARQEGFKG